MNWADYSTEDKIAKVYSKHTISDFWNWWSNNEYRVMEIRMRDKHVIDMVSKKLRLPYNWSGVYVGNATQLKQVIQLARDKTILWFGVNPRKKAYNGKNWLTFGGKDINVSDICYIFVDIDRAVKKGDASNDDINKCDIMANYLLERLGEHGWDKNYAKLCSGNGVQLVLKLDIPIKLPTLTYNSKIGEYIINDEFDKVKRILINGIGKLIRKFAKNYREELNVEIDKCFNIGRVGALPCTKNYKYDGFTWRGIVELKHGINEGLTDYCIGMYEKENKYVKKKIFAVSKGLNLRYRIREGQLKENPIVRLMLDNDLPRGQVNNLVWFQLKCLIRDSKYDIKSDEFKLIYAAIKKKYKYAFPMNTPDKQFQFDIDVLNTYCIKNKLPILFPLWETKNVFCPKTIGEIKFKETNEKEVYELPKETSIFKDLHIIKDSLLDEECLNNNFTVHKYINGMIEKYGESTARYYTDNLINKWINWA